MEINKAAYITGIPLIDNQHKQYMQMLHEFQALAMDTATSLDTVKAEFSKLIDYAEEHLGAEEYLMQTNNYPLFQEHLLKHNFFREKVNDFSDVIAHSPDLDIAFFLEEIFKVMHEWFLKQILNDDVKMAEFLNHQKNEKETSD